MNKLTNVIDGFQSELKAGISKIVKLLTDSDRNVRSSTVDTIRILGQQGK
jgi:hypothetical protein